ncbi:hypothetical protein RFI_00329, partial [Reticulomyxa filosa]
NKVIFSDETKKISESNMFGKKPNQGLVNRFLIKRSMFGGKYIVNVYKIDSGIYSKIYKEILKDDMLNSANYCVDDEDCWWFQQDNTACNKLKK